MVLMNTISIVTPVRNSPELLIETMQSISGQIGIGIEFNVQHIIVDGDSEDDTLDRAKAFIDANEQTGISYVIFSEKDQSMYDAISKGLALCTGQILAYQNAGDIYHVGAFAAISFLFSNSNCRWAYGRKATMNFHGTCVSDTVAIPYLKTLVNSGFHGLRKPNLGFFQQESLFFKLESLQDFDVSKFARFKLAGDFYLFQHLSNQERGYFIDSLISGHRLHENQLSLNLSGYRLEMNPLLKKPNLLDYTIANLMKIVSFLPQNLLRRLHSKLMIWNHGDKNWNIIVRNRC